MLQPILALISKLMQSLSDNIEKILLTEQEISARLNQLATEIHTTYTGKDLTIVAVLTGSIMFVADLLRRVSTPLRLDSMGVSSYRGKTRSTGDIILTKNLRLDVKGRDVLIVDDILDTGLTLGKIFELIQNLSPNSLKTCVLIEKEVHHHENLKADFVGFHIPNQFVVGYGLDFEERYRNLPYIATLKQNVTA